MSSSKRRGCLAAFFRWMFRIGLFLFLIGCVAFIVLFRHAIKNRLVDFPREIDAWEQLRTGHVDVDIDDGWNDYRGVCHSHSHFSHDSSMPFDSILQAAKEARLDFLFMSDHCSEGRGDFSVQWRGERDGVVFFPGYEMSDGFLSWGLPEGEVLDCTEAPEVVAKRIVAAGGSLFFAHSEQERLWDLPEASGMEIYNIHTDLLDESLLSVAPDLFLNSRAYPEQTFRTVFDRHPAIMARWDAINEQRKFAGFSANDAHQNVGLRGEYGALDTLQLISTSGDPLRAWKLNFVTRPIVRLLFGPLEQGRELFRFDLDPYARSLRFVNMHLLAKEKTSDELLDALKNGRGYVGFDLIADSSGFVFRATDAERAAQVTMGESMPWTGQTSLQVAAVLPCLFQVWQAGRVVAEGQGREFRWAPPVPGNYRVEASVMVGSEWVPWVYTNHIRLTGNTVTTAK